ncbi:MAG: hydantoinase/oxoprolinase family protein [Planctomycetota bacterium]|jgi:probable H4MPT-linked C1 transfer pathway protein
MTSKRSSKKKDQNSWLGLDIGGANLKLAHSNVETAWSKSLPFAMWKESTQLASALARAIDDSPEFQGIAVTMTGELADCFATRAQGVACILDQVTRLFPAPLVFVYCVDGKFRSPSQAARDPWMAAASNWHALANWSRRLLPASKSSGAETLGVMVDIGSTTIDVIGVSSSSLLTSSKTDSDRLKRRELIYTGVERSNLCGLLRSVPLHGKNCPVMNEQFATTRDAYLWLGYFEDDSQDHQTADGQPATRQCARYRLARLVGEDGSTLADSDIDAIAQSVMSKQVGLLRRSMERVLGRIESRGAVSSMICAGHGGFLLRQTLEDGLLASRFGFGDQIWLSDKLGEGLSRCAPAFAVSQLASEQSD